MGKVFTNTTFTDAVCKAPSAKETSGNTFGSAFPGAKPPTESPLGEVCFDATVGKAGGIKIAGSGGEKNPF